jgi:two-component system CheB/CheR fusion protein
MPVTKASDPPAAIVGIGASAGGIEAMKRFLAATPADTGLGFVLVMHLQPGHESHLVQVLQRTAKIDVVEAKDSQAVQPDTLYVIPPDSSLTIADGVLHLDPVDRDHPYHQIDTFFRALAADRQDRAVCAVLAGAGSDGSIGLRAIKEHGGLALAARTDAPGRSEDFGALPAQDSMPRAAAATGLADHVVSIEEMPQIAVAYARHLDRLAQDSDGLQKRLQDNLPAICERIRKRTDHDLRQYKSATLLRRIQRRMQALQTADPAGYLARLDSNPEEIDTLYHDILIGVTRFFRDPDAFAALEKNVVPQLLDRAERTGEAVRVWVPGCGSGEEAYSLAILLHQECDRRDRIPDIQVFGTDVDAEAIRHARSARYPRSVADQLTPEQRTRYLEDDGDFYRMVREIRELCLFSEHDLTRHPPFSRLDLISCRNLLIYLNADLQARLVPLFHYALRQGGYLFLGASETLGQHGELFDPVDKKQRIFRRRETARPRVPEFPLAAGGRLLPHLPLRRPQDEDVQSRLTRKAERAVLDDFGPPYVILNANREAIYLAPGAGRYLELPVGSPRCHVLDMAPAALRPPLRNALRAAAESSDTVIERRLQSGQGGRPVDLSVKRIKERSGDAEMYLVVFKESAANAEQPPAPPPDTTEQPSERNGELERELVETRSDLQATIEELEASNEELQSANEELLSMNEELQSSNEELESSKEELQSVNEEMETVNDELRRKVEDLNRANADLRNLIESTRIATIFLDRERRIKWFTPDARELFNLLSTDVGRPFSDLSGRLDAPPERELMRIVETGSQVERQVQLADGSAWYIMRLLPYRTAEDRVDGVVLTFIDITQLQEVTSDLASVMELVPVGIALSRDADAERVRVNLHGRRLLGLDTEEISGTELAALIGDGDTADTTTRLPLLTAAANGARVAETEATVRPHGAESQLSVLLAAAPLGESGAPGRGAIMSIVDISDLKAAQHRQRLLMRALQHRVRNMLASIRAMAMDTMDSSATLEEFAERFEGRLDALALTETLVSRRGGGSIDLRELIDEILLPEATHEEVTTHGPEVALDSRAGQLLALALNELKTNAIKHGVLFAADGRVVVRWGVVTDDQGRTVLRLRWRETGLGELSEAAPGFGRELIEEGVPHELGGRASWKIADGGLTCVIDVPMEPHVLSVGEADDLDSKENRDLEGP